MSTPTPPKPKTAVATAPADLPEEVDTLTEYVVTADAITYRTGKKPDEVQRFNQGARLRLYSDDDRTIDLLGKRAIAVRGERMVKPTARQVFAAIGADDDPAEPPVQSAIPMEPASGAPAL